MSYIPFSELTDAKQAKVWALADALCMGDPLPLVRYFGNGAPTWYENVRAAITDAKPDHRIVMICDYWRQMQKVPFIAAFVLDPA